MEPGQQGPTRGWNCVACLLIATTNTADDLRPRNRRRASPVPSDFHGTELFSSWLESEVTGMKPCMWCSTTLTTIMLARCALNPAIDGVPAAHSHGEVAIVGLEFGTSRGPDWSRPLHRCTMRSCELETGEYNAYWRPHHPCPHGTWPLFMYVVQHIMPRVRPRVLYSWYVLY